MSFSSVFRFGHAVRQGNRRAPQSNDRLTNISEIAETVRQKIRSALARRDLSKLLIYYDNKEMFMALAARHLKGYHKNNFESWLVRILQNNQHSNIVNAIKESLPIISAR